MGSYSVVQCLRHLMGQPLYCSTADVGLWGERGYSDGSTTYTWLSSIALLRWLPGFPPQAFSSQSPPSLPLDPSLHRQQQPSSWDHSTLPKLQLPAPVPSRGPTFLSRVCMAAARSVWVFPFRLPQISCFTLRLKCFSSESDNCPDVGIGPQLQFPHLLRAGPVLLTLLFSPSFVLPSFVWFYIFSISSGQVLLSALSWCSACTSVSEGVFLMYPWREMYSMSTYSSAILFSSHKIS